MRIVPPYPYFPPFHVFCISVVYTYYRKIHPFSAQHIFPVVAYTPRRGRRNLAQGKMSVANDTLGSKGRAEQRGAPPLGNGPTSSPRPERASANIGCQNGEALQTIAFAPARTYTQTHLMLLWTYQNIYYHYQNHDGVQKTAKNNNIFGIFKAFCESKT